MNQPDTNIYDAAEAIDALLEASDGELLAAMALYKSSLLELFGRSGLVEILRQAIDEAPTVDYFSRRSRREIDPGRPEVNLRVDDAAALVAHPALLTGSLRGVASVLNGGIASDQDHATLLEFKSAVVFEEVCRPMATKMNAALAPHWERAKSRLAQRGVNPAVMRMLLCNMFSIRVVRDDKIKPADKMCQLGLFV